MAVLKEIFIDGQIRYNYAHMSATYRFFNTSEATLSPQFVFPVPQGGRLLGFQFLSPEGRLERASVCPLTEENLKKSGFKICRISPSLYALSKEGMEPKEEMQILLELILPLAVREDGVRLVFPLTGDESIRDAAVTLQLYMGQTGVKGRSLSHPVRLGEEQKETVVRGEFLADRDFVLDFKMPLGKSSGIIQERHEESIGIYRLCTVNPAQYHGRKKERVLLCLSNCGGYAQLQDWRMQKELCYRLVQALPAGTSVQIMAEEPLFENFLPAGEETLTRVFDALKETSKGGEKWENLPIDKDTLVLVLSDGGSHVQLPCNRQVHLLTLGNDAFSPLAEYWERRACGKHLHFYPEDITERKAQAVIGRLLLSGAPVEVTALDGSAQEVLVLSDELEYSGYLDVAARFTGRAPDRFQVWQDGVAKETIGVTELTCYNHFPMAQKLYAGEKIKRLEDLLTYTDAGTVSNIKKQIEALSMRYEILSKETMLALADRQGEKQGMVVQFGFCGKGISPRRTIFGERNTCHSSQEECLSVLHQSIRNMGGIFDADALTYEARAEQTAWAILALYTVKEKDRTWLPVIASGEAYLKNILLKGTVGWLYEKRGSLAAYRKELKECLPDLPEEMQDVKSAAQHLLRLFTA